MKKTILSIAACMLILLTSCTKKANAITLAVTPPTSVVVDSTKNQHLMEISINVANTSAFYTFNFIPNSNYPNAISINTNNMVPSIATFKANKGDTMYVQATRTPLQASTGQVNFSVTVYEDGIQLVQQQGITSVGITFIVQ